MNYAEGLNNPFKNGTFFFSKIYTNNSSSNYWSSDKRRFFKIKE